MARVLDLDRGPVPLRRAVQLHPPARVEREVRWVRGAEQEEPQPVGVLRARAPARCEEAFGRRVGTYHQRDVAQARQDARARDVDGRRARRARGVRRCDARARPPERLRDRRPGHVTRVAVAHRLAAGDELHVLPVDAGVGQRCARGVDAVLDEVAPPLAPRVHAGAENRDVFAHATGFHFQISVSPSTCGSTNSSTSSPIFNVSKSPVSMPSTIIRSSANSTAATP